jgi:hypothetical protein
MLGSIQTDKCVRLGAKVIKFANHTKNSNWKTLAQCTMIPCVCALHKTYSAEPAWKAVGDKLQRSYYLSRVDHDWKIRNKRQRMGIGKHSTVNRTI